MQHGPSLALTMLSDLGLQIRIRCRQSSIRVQPDAMLMLGAEWQQVTLQVDGASL